MAQVWPEVDVHNEEIEKGVVVEEAAVAVATAAKTNQAGALKDFLSNKKGSKSQTSLDEVPQSSIYPFSRRFGWTCEPCGMANPASRAQCLKGAACKAGSTLNPEEPSGGSLRPLPPGTHKKCLAHSCAAFTILLIFGLAMAFQNVFGQLGLLTNTLAPQVATLDNSAAMMSSVDVKCRVCFEPLTQLAAHAEHLRKRQLRVDIAGTSQQRP